MSSAKDIVLRPVTAKEANDLVKRVHYSGKVVPNSQIHIGVFWRGKLEGAMQFGPSLDKRKLQGLVRGTGWNEFIELNRMAFSEALPRNSESRAIAIAMRLLRKHTPHLKWVVSFSDGTQCGDGTIYRASGFLLTGIKKNTGQRIDPKTGEVFSQVTFSAHRPNEKQRWKSLQVLEGFQLRYVYFLDSRFRDDLTVPVLPFEVIERHGARMYRGRKLNASEGEESSRPPSRRKKGGASPTLTLQPDPEV